MQFLRRYEDLELGGQTVRIYELTAQMFRDIMAIEDEDTQLLTLLAASIENGPKDPNDILRWPNSVVNQLTQQVMALNGLIDPGN